MAEPLTFTIYDPLDPEKDRKVNGWVYKDWSIENLALFISKLGFPITNTLPGQKEGYSGTTIIDSSATCDIDWRKLNLAGTIDWTDCALENLNEVYGECLEANWDGYGASPIFPEAYFEASKLLRIIPNSYPMPDILPESDGGIGLEWYKERDFSFVISVGGKNIITYVGRFGKNNEIYGTEYFKDSVSKIILDGLRRLFSTIE